MRCMGQRGVTLECRELPSYTGIGVSPPLTDARSSNVSPSCMSVLLECPQDFCLEGKICRILGDSGGHSPAEPRTDRAAGSSPRSCRPCTWRLHRSTGGCPAVLPQRPGLAGFCSCPSCSLRQGDRLVSAFPGRDTPSLTFKPDSQRNRMPFREDSLRLKPGRKVALCFAKCPALH